MYKGEEEEQLEEQLEEEQLEEEQLTKTNQQIQ